MGLLEVRQILLQLVNMMLFTFSFKTLGMNNKYLFIKVSIQESTLGKQVVYLPTFVRSNGENHFDGFLLRIRRKGLLIVYVLSLNESFGHKSSLMPLNGAISIKLGFIDLFRAYNLFPSWKLN